MAQKKITFSLVAATALAVLASSCAGTQVADRSPQNASPPAHAPAGPLRVVMFPYIPPFDSPKAQQHLELKAWLESNFRDSNAGRQVQIEFRNRTPEDFTDAGPADLVEMELDELATLGGRAAAWPLQEREVVPGAWSASLLEGRPHAWPTYVCTHVVYSTDAALRNVRTLAEMRTFLRAGAGTGAPLSADFWGTSTTPHLFVDAALDNGRGPRPPASDPIVVAALRELVGLCGPLSRTGNACLDDSMDPYKEGRLVGFERLLNGASRGLFGYSEFAYYLLRPPSTLLPSALNVISAPLGPTSHPLLFVDGLVMNTRCGNDTGCAERALAFARFLTSPDVQLALAFGKDTEARGTQRYLLMAQRSFWQTPSVMADTIYSQLRDVVDRATPMVAGAPSREVVWEALRGPGGQ